MAIIYFVVMCIITPSFAQIDLSSSLSQCQGTDQKSVNLCLAKTFLSIRPYLRTGLPDINVPPLEPIHLPYLNFIQNDGSIKVNASLTNVQIKGFANFTLKGIQADIPNRLLRMAVTVPVFKIKGRYTLDGHLLSLPIVGRGPFRAILFGISLVSTSRIATQVGTDGVERLTLHSTVVDFNLKGARVNLENLFDGDPVLGQTVNLFIRENDQLILHHIRPGVSKQVAELVEQVMKNALSTIPVSIFDTNPAASEA